MVCCSDLMSMSVSMLVRPLGHRMQCLYSYGMIVLPPITKDDRRMLLSLIMHSYHPYSQDKTVCITRTTLTHSPLSHSHYAAKKSHNSLDEVRSTTSRLWKSYKSADSSPRDKRHTRTTTFWEAQSHAGFGIRLKLLLFIPNQHSVEERHNPESSRAHSATTAQLSFSWPSETFGTSTHDEI